MQTQSVRNAIQRILAVAIVVAAGCSDEAGGNRAIDSPVAAGVGGLIASPAGSGAGTSGMPAAGGGSGQTAAGAGAGGVPSQMPAGAGAGGASGAPEAGGSAGAATADAGAEPPPEACNDADRTPAPMPLSRSSMGSPPTGPYEVTVQTDSTLDTHTIYQPELRDGVEHPIVVWGNGGCSKNGLMFAEFLIELASHGLFIVADGPPNGSGGGSLGTDGTALTDAIDWAIAENDRPCSPYYRKLNPNKVAAMGQSCGGLMTFGASSHPALTTIGIWNSGMFMRDQRIYDGLHTSIGFFIGGESDIAYPQAEADFAAITKDLPIWYGNLDVGHGGTYFSDNGGEFGRVGAGWLKWWLLDDQSETGRLMFEGSDCGLCDSDWVIEKKNMP